MLFFLFIKKTKTIMSLYSSIELTLGPMFSDKTTTAFLLYDSFDPETVLMCCPLENTRDNGKTLKSHKDVEIDVLFFRSSLDILDKIDDNITRIIIDEVQFISNLKDLCYILLRSKNVSMIHLFGLNSDFEQTLFQPIAEILPYVFDRITYLKSKCSYCETKKSAIYSVLKDDTFKKNKTIDGHIIGAEKIFDVLCSECFLVYKKVKKFKKNEIKQNERKIITYN